MKKVENQRQMQAVKEPQAGVLQSVPLTVKRMSRLDGEGTGRAFCDVAVAEAVLIKGIKVVEGKNGLFVSMPRQQGKDGGWYDTVVPLSKEVRQQISEAVLSAYQVGGATAGEGV